MLWGEGEYDLLHISLAATAEPLRDITRSAACGRVEAAQS